MDLTVYVSFGSGVHIEGYLSLLDCCPMKLLPIFLLISSTAFAQTSESLSARYGEMKEKSQTFKDYKVIKETTLDAFWASVADSIARKEQALVTAIGEIESVKNQIAQVQIEMKQKEAAVSEIVFDSEHITVLGISFHKAFFISLFFILSGSLIGLLALSFIRSQFLHKSAKEKAEAMLILNSEFEEYKHRAVEKQMKLSRELQNERNRLAELGTHH